MRPAWFATLALVLAATLSAACGDGDTSGAAGSHSVAAAISTAPTEEPTPKPLASGPGLTIPSAAPEFIRLEGWMNSKALTTEGLAAANRVVLVDFWTYTCINCIRTLPFSRDWHDKYADHGLTIVGVHAPEFDFEEERDNALAAVDRHAIGYPVAQDNEMATWRACNNFFWPAKYLIGADGNVRFQHFGEGRYDETESQIRRALEDADYDVSTIPLGGVDSQRLDPHARTITRELYGGYERNYTENGLYAAQAAYYEGPDHTVEYQDVLPETERNHSQWYLQGGWRNEREAVVHARETDSPSDYLAFRFVARSVDVVLRSATGEPYTVLVIDGSPLPLEEAGAEPREYHLVELPMIGDRELRLSSTSSDFSMLSVTFGAYSSGA